MGEILFYHYLPAALETAGASRETLEGAKSPAERIAVFASHHQLIANTAAYWRLR